MYFVTIVKIRCSSSVEIHNLKVYNIYNYSYFRNPESIWEVCPCLRLVKELNHSVDSENAIQAEDHRARDSLNAFTEII